MALPNSARLGAVWEGAVPASGVEQMARDLGRAWAIQMQDPAWWIVGDVQPLVLREPALRLTRAFVDAIDDRLCWSLADRAVHWVEDEDAPPIVTAGELIDRLAMGTALLRRWPSGEATVGPALREFADRYDDELVRAIAAGAGAPRRHSAGLPPAQEPMRVVLSESDGTVRLAFCAGSGETRCEKAETR
ncbi:hypothetical protein [Nocardia puris]|uniref:hypothetical protein n=1 Tax=Nocardia puris TaxID=208602 RepID=UPI002E1D0791